MFQGQKCDRIVEAVQSREIYKTGPEVIKLFLCSTEMSTKFQFLIKTKIPTNAEVSFFKSLRCCIYHANKC